MIRKLLTAFLPLVILIAIPLVLRQSTVKSASGVSGTVSDRLVIITPNSESIRYEFTRGFREHYHRVYGREVEIEWRTPGGTSDIVRFIADRFESAFRNYWTENPANSSWSGELAAGFNNPRAVPGGGMAASVVKARKQFLASNVGIGVDLFFGGGQYDHQRQADKGYAVDAGIQKLHPEWFRPECIPQQFSGEKFYDSHGRYYGSCLAAFGICWNRDRIKELAVLPPESWTDLGRPQFFRQLAIADPTKSGSVNKCFEMMVQQQMAAAVAGCPADGLETGWADGLNLIRRIAANSRVVTDSASKVTHDTAAGNAAAGICIDFYGQSEAEWSAVRNHGVPRMEFTCPADGTSVSADPVQLLRGAPNRKVAVAFIEFVLSDAGQKLWSFRPGTPGGPVKYALLRMPIRRDFYRREYLQYMSYPEMN
ncbi:MAG: ABC transporter substrate-binding protein, partial [Victivallales bacterium]|nr:ABC transporter substrate-binding protein [Victivallales bacterium]